MQTVQNPPRLVRDLMTVGVETCPPDTPLSAAAEIMLDQGVRTLFLMHHAGGIEYPAAQISYRHYLRAVVAQEDEDLRDLGILAKRQSPLEIFVQRRDEARKKSASKR